MLTAVFVISTSLKERCEQARERRRRRKSLPSRIDGLPHIPRSFVFLLARDLQLTTDELNTRNEEDDEEAAAEISSVVSREDGSP